MNGGTLTGGELQPSQAGVTRAERGPYNPQKPSDKTSSYVQEMKCELHAHILNTIMKPRYGLVLASGEDAEKSSLASLV